MHSMHTYLVNCDGCLIMYLIFHGLFFTRLLRKFFDGAYNANPWYNNTSHSSGGEEGPNPRRSGGGVQQESTIDALHASMLAASGMVYSNVESGSGRHGNSGAKYRVGSPNVVRSPTLDVMDIVKESDLKQKVPFYDIVYDDPEYHMVPHRMVRTKQYCLFQQSTQIFILFCF